ncbi:MAG: 30S ribosomal protein S8 [Campylobacteraceae bacterium 4484_166]|nr:MAG: 30S ribosomal protein S8 [Campylobacteraceae bacterium 4484_166]
MMNDLIADALTRIRNASSRKLDVTSLLHSKAVEGVVQVLLQKEYIEAFDVIDGDNNKKTIKIVLKYDENEKSAINELKRVSKPGRRVYKSAKEVKNFKSGYGTIVISTNKGIVPNDKAYENNTGGEVLCTVW